MRRIEAVVFVVVLVAAVVAGVLNAQWYGGGWFAQVSVNGPNYVDVRLSDMYGHTVVVPGGWAGALGPIYGWDDVVYAQVVSGPPGCSVSPTSQWVGEFWPYATFTVNCPSSTLTTTTATAPPTVTITKTLTTTVTSTLTTTLTATSTVTTTATLTTTATVTYTTTVTTPVTMTVTTTVTSPIIVRKAHNGWVTILLAIITNLAKGFHWIAERFTFKPITQVQADFYVPIVEWGWSYNFGTRVFVLPNGVAVAYNGTTTVTATIVNGTTTTVTTVTLTGNNTVYWAVIVLGHPAEWTLHDSYNYHVNGNGNATGVFYITGVTDTLSLTAPQSCTVYPSKSATVIAGTGTNSTFIIECPPSAVNSTSTTTGTGTSTGTGTGTSPPPTVTTTSSGFWVLNATFLNPSYCNDFYWEIDEAPGVILKSGVVGETLSPPREWSVLIEFPWSQASVRVDAWAEVYIYEPGYNVWITPSGYVTINAPSSGSVVTYTWTVDCGASAPSSTTTSSTPTSTGTPTSTPTSTSTVTGTSTTSSPPPTASPTSVTTVTTPIPKVVNDYAMGCAPGTVPLGSEVAFECFIALNGYAGIQAVAQGSIQGGAYETATLTYTVNGQTATPGGVIGSWYWSGSCPPGTLLVFQASNMNHVWNLNGATDTTITWFVTVTAYCQPKGAQFAFLSTWSPPELPIDWLLRGGTDVEGVIAPLYLRAWNAYASAWLYENGFTLDLLLLMALILPVLVRPGLRRLRLA